MFGLIENLYSKNDPAVWQALLVQSIENAMQIEGVLCIMPDRYLLSVPTGSTLSPEEKSIISEEMKTFIKNFALKSGYLLLTGIRIDWIANNTKNSCGVNVHCWVSRVWNVHASIMNKTEDGNLVSTHTITPGKKLIAGRGDNCILLLKHKYISGNHAIVSADMKGYIRIVDLNSANGTYVSGKRLSPFKEYEFTLPISAGLGEYMKYFSGVVQAIDLLSPFIRE